MRLFFTFASLFSAGFAVASSVAASSLSSASASNSSRASNSLSSTEVSGEGAGAASVPPATATAKVTINDKQLKVLEELVNINSDTAAEMEGVDNVQNAMERMLKNLGFTVERIPNPDTFQKSAKLLVATFAGKNPQMITLLGHADTVFPTASAFTKFERVSDAEAKGPGVIDDKGGLVVAIEALRLYLEEHPTPTYGLRVVISSSEETGSNGFHELFKQYAANSIALFGLEPALDDGDIVNSRRGDRWYDIKIKGREAHSGRAHDQGINACVELAVKIEKLQKLTNYKKEVTISIGAIHGGVDKYAIVCGEATAKLDVRFSDEKNRTAVLQKVESILKTQYISAKSDGARAVTEFNIVDDPHPFPADAATKTLVDIYTKVVAELEGKKIAARRSGGSSDANFFYRPGLIVLDGLGAVGSGMHTHSESLRVQSLQTRAQALAKLIEATTL